jgi:ArsR family transcriptional regulator, cadmium/lead-responsive transcriptional repressor
LFHLLSPYETARLNGAVACEAAHRYIVFWIQSCMYYTGVETLIHSAALARFGYALSDTTRTLILLSLRKAPGYPSELAEEIDVSRQIVSNHLACLRGCGLVVAVPEGRRARYELADPRIGNALDDLIGLVLAVDPSCCPDAQEDGCC